MFTLAHTHIDIYMGFDGFKVNPLNKQIYSNDIAHAYSIF